MIIDYDLLDRSKQSPLSFSDSVMKDACQGLYQIDYRVDRLVTQRLPPCDPLTSVP